MTPCPKCAAPLVDAVVDDGGGMLAPTSILACEACGGVWLDNERTRQLVDGILARRTFAVAEETARTAAGQRTHAYRQVPTGACPICGRPMSRVTTTADRYGIDGIELDLCAAHGTWFDPRELATLAAAMDTKKRVDAANAEAREAALQAEVDAIYPPGSGVTYMKDLFPVAPHQRWVWRTFP